jgi:hypothetical protein
MINHDAVYKPHHCNDMLLTLLLLLIVERREQFKGSSICSYNMIIFDNQPDDGIDDIIEILWLRRPFIWLGIPSLSEQQSTGKQMQDS